MTKKATAFIFISALFVAAVLFGFSAARYESSVTVTESLNYAKTVGAISVYEPTSVTSYPADVTCYDEENICFRIGANKPGCDNIRFVVTNKVTKDGKDYFNEVNTDYYIRIIDPDNPDAASPVEYKAYEENADFTDISKAYSRDEQTGYYYAAAFNLPATETERVFRFSMQVTWAGNKTLGLHKTAVQMVRKRADGSYAVIAETELNFRFDITLDYFVIDDLNTVYESRLLPLAVGDKIDFKNEDMIPDGYKLQYASSFAIGWAGVDQIEVNDQYATFVIQVRLCRKGYVAVTLNYRDRGQPTTATNPVDGTKYRTFATISTQVVWFSKSVLTPVDFSDAESRKGVGVKLPDGHEYIAGHCDYKDWVVGDTENNYFNDVFAAPLNTSADEMLIDVYVAKKKQPLKVKTILVSGFSGTEELIREDEFEFGEDGKLTFTPAELRGLCGKRPDGYDYTSIQLYVRVVKGDWTGNTMSIGNMYIENQPLSDVNVDYYKIYQGVGELTSATGYCLANPNTVLLIKAWW